MKKCNKDNDSVKCKITNASKSLKEVECFLNSLCKYKKTHGFGKMIKNLKQ